jgi:uncharacterized membrane protein YdjX (TVP38/TMEM64 family)
MSVRLRAVLLLAVLILLLAMALIWGMLASDDNWQPARLQELAGRFADRPWLPWAILAGVVVGQQLAIPQLLLVPVGVIALGPWLGFAVVYLGTLLGAVIGYMTGRYLGRRSVRRLSGTRMKQLSRSLARRGVVSMIVINMVPIVSQTIINLAAGTTHIRFRHFLLGTAIGIVPPTVVVVAATHVLLQLGRMPTAGEAAVLMVAAAVIAVGAWIVTHRVWNWLVNS